ncbi:phage tail fiber protein [Klebsiella michiganensis]|uniref:phage tail fiber domain-containing protein n=1 Tax=Klebsiella michiganensis TaxID=1134687 RepID=UPI00287E80EF|nr:phage tail fiber protein [Klebsiella michiganensis]MDS7838892.1 phage tail fiber protein [Klebsiella michiganensis]
MSVPNQTPYNIYTANGLTTVFAYEFYLISASDIQVTINGNEVTSGYTVSGVGNTGGGEVTFLTAPANGSTVIFERVTPTYRLTDYQDNGDLLADTVNKDFDRLWMAIQRAFIYLGVALTRPLFGGGPFNANGYRIANLADPVNDQDAATKKYVIENGNTNLARTLRVPESHVEELPPVSARRDSLFGWNSSGKPVPIFSMTDTADLALKLASNLVGLGASLSGLEYGGTVQDAIKFITPFMFKGLVIDDDWALAIVAADTIAATLGLPLIGFDQTFSVRSLSLISDHIEGIGFVPVAGYTGAGPIFKINQVTGKLYFKGSCKGFTSVGAKFIRGDYSGIPQLTLDGCEFSDNGSLLRTTCVNAVNTASDFVIPVVDATGFVVGNYIWIGDSKCMIAGISDNTITLVNNGSAPTLYSGGTGTGSYKAGQFFTRDGDGKNGATIGEGGTEAGWGLTVQNGIKLMNNGWFGLFHYVKAKGGTVSIIGKVEGGNNGYCAMGLAYVQGGEISGFKFYENGNNGLDIFETTGDLSISDGLCYGNGVDGVFACGNGTGPKISRVKSRDNFRIGILTYGRTAAPVGFNVTDCECINNGLYDVCMTGVRAGDVRGNTLGGAKEALKIEGRNGLLNPSGITIDANVFTLESTGNDINANIGGYTDGGESGAISVLNNRYNGRNPKHTITNFNRSQSRFVPVGRVSFTSSYTAAAGATIGVPLVFYKPNATSNIDVLGGQVEIQICSNPSLQTIGTVTTALRTAGVELSNGATTNGKILAMAAFGTLSYNFTLTTAGTVYLNIRSPYGDGVIQLTWT